MPTSYVMERERGRKQVPMLRSGLSSGARSAAEKKDGTRKMTK